MKTNFRQLVLLLAVIIFTIAFSSCTKKQSVSINTLLNEITDRSSLTVFPEPNYQLKQFSSYDRKSISKDEPGWFANADYTQFLSEENNNGRREFVLFDHEGPGAVVRWWMTFAGAGSHEGILRIYLDGAEEPLIEDNILKILSGQILAGEPLSSSVSPMSDYYKRGHNLYLPIPYGKHCKITYECDSITITDERRRPSVYYNINYRDYSDKTIVETLTMDELKSAEQLIEKVNQELLTNRHPDTEALTAEMTIEPGQTLDETITKKNSAISEIRIKLEAEDINQALRSTVLEASFDGKQTVWVPVGDFFGTGFEIHGLKSWNSSVYPDGSMLCKWLMPFKNEASVRIINYGAQDVKTSIEIYTEEYNWNNRSMHFGASWHEYNKIQSAGSEYVGGSGEHFDINYIDITGKGVYVGDAVTIFNTADAWWGEGDEKIFVDNESFPSSIGTGTEDYYGYAWCRPEIFSHPFIAQPCGTGNFHPGMTVNLRYRSLDAIPFNDKISSNIELWHWAPTIMNYALTSYWYALPGYSINIEPDIDAVKIKVPRKRADIIQPVVIDNSFIEGEYLEVMSVGGGSAETQFITSWDWSNKGQLWWRNAEKGDKLHTRFTMSETARYIVSARLTKASDYGIIAFEFNAETITDNFNGYSEGEQLTEIVLGEAILLEGDNIFTIVIRGKDNKAKPGNMAGIDYLKFEKTK